jgi:LPXTG-motif cell wall-anchored protein
MNSTWRKKALLTVGFVAMTTGGVLGVSGAAIASADPLPAVVDTAAYPAPLPAGCPEGAGALAGVVFDNGRGSSQSDLRQLDLRAGDTLTMRWSSAVDGCAAPDGQPAVAVTLASYGADGYGFDHTTDQALLTADSCGGDAADCLLEQGTYQLSLVMPGGAAPCFVQVDAVLGAPLAVVGPGGSYYTAGLRGAQAPTLLIAAGTSLNASCTSTTSTTSTTVPVAPPTTATPPPAPPPTATTTPVLPPTIPTTETTVPAGPPLAQQVSAAVASRAAQLPTTGAHSGVVALLGLALVLVGLATVVAARTRFGGTTTR